MNIWRGWPRAGPRPLSLAKCSRLLPMIPHVRRHGSRHVPPHVRRTAAPPIWPVSQHGAQHVTDETILLSYDELAERFGINRESARQLTLRKRWARRKGNDGRARVEVPLDALPSVTSDAPSHDTSDDTDVARVLTRHIERLEEALENAGEHAKQIEAERDAARDETRVVARDRDAAREAERMIRAQVEGLQAVLAAEKNMTSVERDRVAELKAERDQWRDQAQRSWWKRLVG